MPTNRAVISKRMRSALLLSAVALASASLSAAETTMEQAAIEALQQQIRDLQVRVDRLEGKVQQGLPVNAAQTVQPIPGGWRKAANWSLLIKGMTDGEVIDILGEPQQQRSANKFEFWEYGDGMARLYMRRLKSWDIPTGIDDQSKLNP
ncbi:MAG: hypothetical protein LJE59_11445 [Chromatiaceae bacterium]|nr:hypothetical protein [Chromatiaceae bacterium]